MNLSELKTDTVYVNMRGFHEMVVLDTNNLYAEDVAMIGSTWFVDPGKMVAVIASNGADTLDLVEAAKALNFYGSARGASFKLPPYGARIEFVPLHSIAGERDEVREGIKKSRELTAATKERQEHLQPVLESLLPGHLNVPHESMVKVSIDLLEQLVALAQKAKEA